MAIKIAGVDVINDDRELVLAKLTDINSTISSTAVDVFIYDTSNDSDGGAWRHRTQHTSWYNETLNTSTRGSRKEFPAVAVIVAEASKVTIYDGDDPSLPMWMVFNTSNATWDTAASLINGGTGTTAVAAVNGQIAVVSTINGAYFSSFIDDEGYSIRATTFFGYGRYNGGISARNDGLGYSTINSAKVTVSDTINDVAMTVLPDAPTDPATGLPVPTIAVATAGGLSVINNDGTVYDSSYTGGLSDVGFWADGTVVYGRGGFTAQALTAEPSAYQNADGFGTYILHGSLSLPTYFPYQSGLLYLPFGDNEVAGGNPSGITSTYSIPCLGRYVIGSTLPQSLGCVTTSTYTTGWMNGDIKLAALADTTAETLSGSELVTNGDFPAGLLDGDVGYDNGDGTVDGWTANGQGTLSVVSGALRVLNDTPFSAGSSPTGQYAISTSAGQSYTVTFDVVGTSTGNSGVGVSALSGGTNRELGEVTAVGVGTYTFTFKATASTSYLKAFSWSITAGSYADFDNISVRLADPDRSVNGNGLGVHGSITKAAVATGADVVGYSNFSSSNYLEQPYNSDLDFGTGDFCVMGWVNFSGSAYAGLVALSSERNSTANPGFGVYYNPTNLYFRVSPTEVLPTSLPPTGQWVHVCAVRTDSDNTGRIYINGQLDVSSTSMGSSSSPTNNSATLVVGGYWSGSGLIANSAEKYALIRISATAPTADQIKKIYEDEKFLFQENAKATLYGSSDAVTALAHDPVTDLLHVGTSAGRSVFQGLRRVDNTTTAVSTAISANDSLIVEQ